MVKTITAVAAFTARHPEVGKAYDKLLSSPSLKVSGGAAVKTPETLPVSGGGSVMGYVKLSGNGVGAGVNASVSGAALGVGKKLEGDLPIAKDNKVVNPLENAKVETSSTVSGGKMELTSRDPVTRAERGPWVQLSVKV